MCEVCVRVCVVGGKGVRVVCLFVCVCLLAHKRVYAVCMCALCMRVCVRECVLMYAYIRVRRARLFHLML